MPPCSALTRRPPLRRSTGGTGCCRSRRAVGQQVDGGRSAAAARRLIHRQNETPRQRPARQPPPRRIDALEERRLRLVEPGRPMVGRDVVPLAALLMEPEPPPALLPEVVLSPHPDDRADPARSCRPPDGRAGFTGRTWLTTSQSPSMRIAARCCFTVGADPGCVRRSPSCVCSADSPNRRLWRSTRRS